MFLMESLAACRGDHTPVPPRFKRHQPCADPNLAPWPLRPQPIAGNATAPISAADERTPARLLASMEN
jgi:hypothetical protein